MVKKCPKCGVAYTEDAIMMFETAIKAGFKINLICGNCAAKMVIEDRSMARAGESAEGSTSGATRVSNKRWWEFWK